MLGSVLPWATAGVFSVAGTDGDGILTLGVGVVVGVLALVGKASKPVAWAVLLLGLAAAGIAVNVLTGLVDGGVTPGGGLIIVGLAAAAVVVAGARTLDNARSVSEPHRAE